MPGYFGTEYFGLPSFFGNALFFPDSGEGENLPIFRLASQLPWRRRDAAQAEVADGQIPLVGQVHERTARRYSLPLASLRAEDLVYLRTFAASARSGAGAFTWTPPDGSAGVFRFDGDATSWTFGQVSGTAIGQVGVVEV